MNYAKSIEDLRGEKGLSQDEMARIIGISQQVYSNFVNGHTKRPPSKIVEYLLASTKNIVDEASQVGDPKGVYKTKNKDFVELSDGKFIMSTPLVSHKAQAGYLTGWGDEEYIAELPQFPIIVDKPHRGDYVSFEVSGESMNDGTSMSINPGDIVTGRKIDRSHWKNKLHLKKYTEFVIVSIKGGIIVKEIVEHDTENCTIVCRSRNPDKKKYPDQVIHLNEVIQMFNIVQVTKKR